MKDKYELQDRLTDAFIHYQWNLENPFPKSEAYFNDGNISQPPWVTQYQTDRLFHAKVDMLVAGVSDIVFKWMGE